jgi:uncharacterized protein YaaQ
MRLILSIVNRDDSNALVDSFVSHGYRATVISTTGGFLRQGNATILVGAEDGKVDEVLQLIKQACHSHTEANVQVGGATVFVLNVGQFQRF